MVLCLPIGQAYLLGVGRSCSTLFLSATRTPGACRGQDSRSSSQGAPSPVSGAPAGSDRQSDARPSRSVGMDLVCVTRRRRKGDSKLSVPRQRKGPRRFAGDLSPSATSQPPKGGAKKRPRSAAHQAFADSASLLIRSGRRDGHGGNESETDGCAVAEDRTGIVDIGSNIPPRRGTISIWR